MEKVLVRETNSDRAYDEVSPMLCKSVKTVHEAVFNKKAKESKDQIIPSIMEPKLDGYRAMARMTSSGTVVMWTRGKKYIHEKIPYITNELERFMEEDEVLDGELVYFKEDQKTGVYEFNFPHVQGVINSLPARAQDLANNYGRLYYAVFDHLVLRDDRYLTDTLEQRRNVRRNILSTNNNFNYVLDIDWLSTSESPSEDGYLEMTRYGFEGAVVKHLNSLYLPGKRTRGWYKMKQMFEVDVVVMGVVEGIGKFEGTMGAVKYGQYQQVIDEETGDEFQLLVYRGQCSGFDDELRNWVWKNREKIINEDTVMSVQHMGLMEGGVHFRHPQFKRFREDKKAEEVIWHDY